MTTGDVFKSDLPFVRVLFMHNRVLVESTMSIGECISLKATWQHPIGGVIPWDVTGHYPSTISFLIFEDTYLS